jgi:glucose-1-phosphate thymidylyltransferase
MLRAVVLARGLGTRMRQADDAAALTPEQRRAADAGLKAMMPVNGVPLLAYALSAIADAGITAVGLVVAPDHDVLRDYLSRHPPTRVDVSFVVQPDARGTAHAVLAAAAWVEADPFLVMNGDNIYPVAALRDLAALDQPGFPAFEAGDLIATSNIPAERIAAFARVELDADGYVRSIVEKPADAEGQPGPAQAISMNLWRFDERIFPACRDVPASRRGEYELPEAVAQAVARGMRVKAVRARGPVLDLSRRADAAALARHLAGVTPWP